MNKNQELEILRETIARLGPDSYVGPWLAQELPSIEHDLRSDYRPLITLAIAKAHAKTTIDDARRQAHEIIVQAQSKADARDKAIDGTIHNATVALRDALRSLDNR